MLGQPRLVSSPRAECPAGEAHGEKIWVLTGDRLKRVSEIHCMAMNLTPGELYFISERDHLTGKLSGYYKIGLVKSSRRGDSQDRLAEHQTGNPRLLQVEHQVDSPAINALETAMHHRYALKRVSGEWFRLTPKELDRAVTVARALASDQASHLRSMSKAIALSGELSTEQVGRATAKDRALFERAHQAKAVLSRVNQLQKLIKEFFSEALDAGQPVGDFIGATYRESTSLDKSALREAHPDVYETFAGARPSTSKQFRIAKAGDDLVVVVPKPVQALGRRIERLLDHPSTKRAYLEELHAAYLTLLEHSSHGEWEEMIVQSQIQERCGTKAGIDGVCSWKRVPSSTTTFDEAGFRRAHPKLASRYTVVRPVQSFGVVQLRSYAPVK